VSPRRTNWKKEIIMRRKARHSFWLLAALVPLLTLGAGAPKESAEPDDGLDVYFRDADLLALADQALPVYPEVEAGESTAIPRDFPDAPPQIPHAVEDMLTITLGDNECLTCHDPENAVEGSDVPLPASHFQAAVMGEGGPKDAMVWVVKDYAKMKGVVGARYNCTMCHTPQATNVDGLGNSFVPARK
jgi:cytochrome c-type protein NapB